MAIYHCSIKIISRGKGKSAVAAAAYRSGTAIMNQYDGVMHDFTRKGGIIHEEIILSIRAPPEFADRSILWNSVEKIEKARNSQLAREIEIALPVELDMEKQISLVREYVRDNFVSKGMCADFSIHDKREGNPHAHIMLTMRPLEDSGKWGAKSRKDYILDKGGQRVKLKNGSFKNHKVDLIDWNSQEKADIWRQAWVETANRYLAAQNRTERIDHRSYRRQGVEQIPTVHMGVSATQMENRGIVTDKGIQNKKIVKQNKVLKEIMHKIAALMEWIKEKRKQTNERKAPNPSNSSSLLQSPTLLEILKELVQKASTSKEQATMEYNQVKIMDRKDYVNAVDFLQGHNIITFEQLQETMQEIKKRYWDANRQIKQTDKLLHERKELIKQTQNYLEYRPFQQQYLKFKPVKQKAYYEKFRFELTLYEAAENYLRDTLGDHADLKPRAWQVELASLNIKRKSHYVEIYKLKDELKEVEVVKKCVENVLLPEQKKALVKNRDMECR